MAGESEEDFSRLSTEELVAHKSWKARVKGYEEASKLFSKTVNEKDPVFSRYLGLVKNFVSDSNQIALEKGLDAALVYLENAAVAPKTAGECCSLLVQKCLGLPKQKLRDKAQEILLMYIELEKPEPVMEALLEGIQNKNPKVVSATVVTLTTALSQFGAKVVGVKLLVKQIGSLMEHRDQDVRGKTKTLAVELYRWIGAALKPQLQSLTPLQLNELESEFSSIAGAKAVPTRYLRSQKPQVSSHGASDAFAGGDSGNAPGENSNGDPGSAAPSIDPWEFLSPTDILPKLSKDFYEQLESKKWNERKEKLDELLKLLTDNPRLEPSANYGELISNLKQIIAKDSNINVVAVSGKCLACVALGLRKKFTPFVPSCAPVVLEKFKEKKPIVSGAMAECIDAIAKTTTLETLSEDITSALNSKTPSVKVQTLMFLARYFATSDSSILTKKVLKIFCPTLVKLTSDSDADVRDNSFIMLGTAMKTVSEKAIMPFLSDISNDNIKMTKIKECCEAAANQKNVGAGDAPAATAARVQPQKRAESAQPAASSRSAGDSNETATSKKPSSAQQTRAAPRPARSEGPKIPEEADIPMDLVAEKAAELFPSELLNSLDNVNWQERSSSVTELMNKVKCLEPNETPTQIILKMLLKKKETHFQVMALRLELMTHLIKNCSFSGLCFDVCLSEFIDKIGDTKQSKAVHEALLCSAEALSLRYVSDKFMAAALEQKNPKTQAEAFSWLATAITDFGLDINVPSVTESMKKSVGASNPVVRNAAIEFAGVLSLFLGSQVRNFFADEKSTVLQLIDASLKKYEGQERPVPTRRWKLVTADADSGASKGGANQQSNKKSQAAKLPIESELSIDDVNEKAVELFSNEAVQNLEHANWQERLNSINEISKKMKCMMTEAVPVQAILRLILRKKETHFQVLSTRFEMISYMAKSCKFSMLCFELCLPEMIDKVGDAKLTKLVQEALSSCAEALSLRAVSEKVLPVALEQKNPKPQAESLTWLAEAIKEFGLNFNHKLCIDSIKKVLSASNPAVRNAGIELAAVIYWFKGALIRNFFSDEKSATVQNLNTAFEKYDGQPTPTPTRRYRFEVPADEDAPPASESAERPSTSAKPASARPSRPASSAGAKKPEGNSRPSSAAPASARKPTPTTTSKSKADESFEGGALIDVNQKQQRFQEEKSLKVLKWQFNTPDEEHTSQLKAQCALICKPELQTQLFHADFKQHLKALDALTNSVRLCPDAVINSLDLLLKWCTLRFFDTNTSVLMKCLAFIKSAFTLCQERSVELHDIEVVSFVPFLLLKLGDGKDSIRADVRQIFTIMYQLYSPTKMFPLLLDGCKSKNARQRSECLEQIGLLIQMHGISVCGQPPSANLKLVAQSIGDRDNAVRNAALNAVVEAYFHLGERIYSLIGNLNPKDLAMLGERVKRSVKTGPVIKKPEQDEKKVVGGGSAAKTQRGMSPGRKPMPLQCTETMDDITIEKEPKPSAGMFQLELSTLGLENVDERDYQMPQLIDHSEADEILVAPFNGPRLRFVNMSTPKRHEIVNQSMDAATALDTAISLVTSSTMDVAAHALAQLDEIIKDDSKRKLLAGKVDQLLMAIYFQFRMAFNTHMIDESVRPDEVVRLYRSLCLVLLSLTTTEAMVQEASEGTLKDLVCQLLTVLLDERLLKLSEGPQVMRSLNVLVVKLVENSNPTSCMVALMRLLRDTLHSHSVSTKFQELVLKCLWKLSQVLSKFASSLQIGRVLAEAHAFYVDFPAASWKQRSDDTPSRTMKTILNKLVEIYGDKILDYTDMIDKPETSEVVSCLRKCLERHNQKMTTSDSYTNNMKTSFSAADPMNSTASSLDQHQTVLADIFKRVGTKEKTKEGLMALHQYIRKHPDADISPFLNTASEFFRNYIRRGLQQIDAEQNRERSLPTPANGSANGKSQPAIEIADVISTTYLNKLQALRQKCGLKPVDVAVSKPIEEDVTNCLPHVRSAIPSEPQELNDSNFSTPPPQPRLTREELNSYKARLDRLKRGQED